MESFHLFKIFEVQFAVRTQGVFDVIFPGIIEVRPDLVGFDELDGAALIFRGRLLAGLVDTGLEVMEADGAAGHIEEVVFSFAEFRETAVDYVVRSDKIVYTFVGVFVLSHSPSVFSVTAVQRVRNCFVIAFS